MRYYQDLFDLITKAKYIPFRKTVLFFALFRSYFNLLVLKKAVLKTICIWATWKCQCRCDYCSNFHLRKSIQDKHTLSLDNFKDIFSSAKRLGSINIHFVGGEPLVGEQLFELIALAKPRTTLISMATNAILLEQKARALRKAGLNFVNVSLDSPYAHIHDQVKGFPGAFKAAIAGIKTAKQEGIKVILTMVLTHKNLNSGEVEAMISLAGKLGVALQLLPVRPMGNFRDSHAMLLDKEDMKKFYRLVSGKKVRWDGRSNYFKTGCPAALEKLTINLFGDVFPCDFIPLLLGNLFEKSLEEIYRDTIDSGVFRDWSRVCRSAFNDEFITKYCDFNSEGCS